MNTASKGLLIAASLGLNGCTTVPKSPDKIESGIELKVESINNVTLQKYEAIISVTNTGNEAILFLKTGIHGTSECSGDLKMLEPKEIGKVTCSFDDSQNLVLAGAKGRGEKSYKEIHDDVVVSWKKK